MGILNKRLERSLAPTQAHNNESEQKENVTWQKSRPTISSDSVIGQENCHTAGLRMLCTSRYPKEAKCVELLLHVTVRHKTEE
jgi:hypothetical protein